MKPNSILQLEYQYDKILLRSKLISSIRRYFDKEGFIEVNTPLLINAPAPEEYIEAPSCGKQFLRTSPELQMKQMLTAGYEKIYQLGPCFREGERGRLHNPEFMMLEWYQAGIDYKQLLKFTQNMITFVVKQVLGTLTIKYDESNLDFSKNWLELTVHDAFNKYCNISPEAAIVNNCFEELLVDNIEPNLGFSKPTVLVDYPEYMAAFARSKKGSNPAVAERWELYLAGIEIANAYSEVTDPKVQRDRFEQFIKTRRETGYKEYPKALDFLDAIDYGLPDSAGCALGVDRLVMVLCNAKSINEVIFQESDH